MIRVCPKRDSICPHGIDCPYSKDQYQCEEGWQDATLPPDRELPTWASMRVHVPEPGVWYVYFDGDSGARYYPIKDGQPNWFWRRMQHLILGLKWGKDRN